MASETTRRTILPSGLRIVTEEVTTVRSASFGIWANVGSRDESPSVAGASHFLEHLLFKGTTKRTALDISSAIDAVGGEMNAFTSKEYTCFYARVIDTDIELASDVICDMITSSIVKSADVDAERNVVLEEISMRDDDPGDLIHDLFSDVLYGDTPVGRPILGTVQSITDMSRTSVNNYYKKRYQPENLVIAVAGNVKHDDVVALVIKAMGDFLSTKAQPANIRTSATAKISGRGEIGIIYKKIEQANLLLGVPSVDRNDPRRFAVAVLNSALGGGMSSRLFQEIREKRGLVYTVYSFAHHYTGTGIFGVYAGTTKEKVNEVVELIKKELADVALNGITEDELMRGKGALRGGLVLGLEETNARMTRIAKGELLYGEYLSLDETLNKIDEVTLEDIKALAAQLFAQKGLLCVVGSFNDKDQFKDLVV